jgi:putative transposase
MKPLAKRKSMIGKAHGKLSIARQCELLQVNRSSYYHQPKETSALNLELMELMDKHYLEFPDKGAERMHKWLTKDLGYSVSLNRIERLYYKEMGLRSLLPGPHTSKRRKDHTVYPYLLRDLKITRSNQVWATDITYIPMEKGFMYLAAIIDLNSRFVLNGSVSNIMEAEWCAELFKETVEVYGKPDIINTDQGSQYTADVFTKAVLSNGIKLSMDGKGRATDNAFIERLWRSVKYEKIYLFPPTSGQHLTALLQDYFLYYNEERRHSSIEDKRPKDVFFSFRPPRPSVRAA